MGLTGERPLVTTDALPGLRPEIPVWASNDSDEPLNSLFTQADQLLLRGRVTKRPWVYGVAATAMVVGANAWFVYQLAVAAQSEPGYR